MYITKSSFSRQGFAILSDLTVFIESLFEDYSPYKCNKLCDEISPNFTQALMTFSLGARCLC